MGKTKFQKMLDFELRAVIFGSEYLLDYPFVDLRRYPNGEWTINAIQQGTEYEISIGRRWFRKKVPLYVSKAIEGLQTMQKKIKEDKAYAESVATNTSAWGWFER